MTGTLINTAAIVFGGLGGLLFGKRLRDRHQETLTMACGVGACLCCVTKTDHGHRCVCKDGPVFDAENMKEWAN